MKSTITKYPRCNPVLFCALVVVFLLSIMMPLPVVARSANSHLSADLSQNEYLWGTGADGDLTISGAAFNINTDTKNTARNCPDAIAYSVIGLSASSAQVSPAPLSSCLKPGDEVLLINMQGTRIGGDRYHNVGRYEFLQVSGITSSQVNFTTPKTGRYGALTNNDAGIGINPNQQRVMLVRVPNYNNVVVNSTLTGSKWDGLKYGLIAFRVKGSLRGPGTIQMSGKGYRGNAVVGGEQSCGESYAGVGGCMGGGLWGGVHRSADGSAGAYATNGEASSVSVGGLAYGVRSLNALFPGSAGGWSGCGDNDDPCIESGAGGNGGGIVYVLANSIDLSGSIKADGAAGIARGGGGAGGSIRIEAGTLSQMTSSAIGGSTATQGGQGRIAVYYQANPNGLNPASGPANPRADIHYRSLTPAPTPTSPPTPQDWGNGADNALTVFGDQTFNINTENQERNCFQGGDAVAYSVVELNVTFAQVSPAPQGDCLKAGDEFLLINLQGTKTKYANTGRYEFLRVASLAGSQVNFTQAKNSFYGANPGDDANIGIDVGQQRVVLMRVPNYEKVIVNGTLTGLPWNGLKHGLVVFRVRGSLLGNGTIQMSGKGYRGTTDENISCGESYGAFGTPCLGAGAWGGTQLHRSGGGGAHGTNGVTIDANGGVAYGAATLNKLYHGSAGGHNTGNQGINPGANGGGIVYILANTINFAGTIANNGSTAGAFAGSGAGGSIRLEAFSCTQLTANAIGGLGNATANAAGGVGRIAIYCWGSLNTGGFEFSPPAFVESLVGG